jgi:uncharacterized membrane protein YphA (DoxX/SURF4 family)
MNRNREQSRNWFNRIDTIITEWMARHGVALLRISVGIVFLWFGVLKFFPNLSPAEDLAARTISALTFGFVQPNVSVPVLALWETVIGLGLISGMFMRATLALLALQMLGTITPLFLFPQETFRVFPIAPTLEGQYIIKNLVLVSAAIVIGATVRGGNLVVEKEIAEQAQQRYKEDLA